MADDEQDGAQDAGQAFARLMNDSRVAAAPAGGDGAPYGYTTDPETGQARPKKAAGRPRKSPPVDELKAQREAAAADINNRAGIPEPDRAPDPGATRRRRRGGSEKPAADRQPVPQFREGVIAKGVNRLYRKGGRIVRVWDAEVGQALIEITRKEDDDDVTVGEAWEELARTNVRIRRALLKVIAGGAWGQLVMAHGPVLLAVLMKDSVRERLPLHKLIAAFFSGDDAEDGPPGAVPGEVVDEGAAPSPGNGLGPLPGGLTAEDLQEMAKVADRLMGNLGGQRRAGTPRARPSAAAAAAVSPPAG